MKKDANFWKYKRPRLAQAIQKNKIGKFTVFDFKTIQYAIKDITQIKRTEHKSSRNVHTQITGKN